MGIYILLTFLSALLFRPKSGVLSCGLFGGGFNRPLDRYIIRKLMDLGLFNQSRGEDSCGYYNGNLLEKGVNEEKKFLDFVLKRGIKENDGMNNVFIGHTRKATHGGHTEGNAHPFNINDRLILAHNGQIHNYYSLMNQNDIDAKGVYSDSLGLGMLLDKVGYKILKEYKGAAALMVHRIAEPNTLYVFHGSGRNSETDETMWEERPLYYLEAREGIYVSSIKDALSFIKEPEDGDVEVQTVPYNRIVRIKDGKIRNTKIVIDRTMANVEKKVTSSAAATPSSGASASGRNASRSVRYEQGMMDINSESTSEYDKLDLQLETLPPRAFQTTNTIFWWKGRYWRDDNVLCHGLICIGKGGVIHESSDAAERILPLYFYNGVILRGQSAYSQIINAVNSKQESFLKSQLTKPHFNFAQVISAFSKYPVTNMDDEGAGVSPELRNVWYWDSKPADGLAITPAFSKRHFHFRKGNLVKVISDDPNEQLFLQPSKKVTDEYVDNLIKGIPPREEDATEYPKEVMEIAGKFRQVYSTYEEALENLEDVAGRAFRLYGKDVATDLLMMKEPTDDAIVKVCDDTILTAIQFKITIEEQMDTKLPSIEEYILDAQDEEEYYDGEEPPDPTVKSEADRAMEIAYNEHGIEVSDAEKLERNEVRRGLVEDYHEHDGPNYHEDVIDQTHPTGGKVIKMGESHQGIPLIKDPGFLALGGMLHVNDVNDDSTREDTDVDKERKWRDDDEASDMCKDLLKSLKSLRKQAIDFAVLSDSDLAQDVHWEALNVIDSFNLSLGEIFAKHKQANLVSEVKKSKSEHNQ